MRESREEKRELRRRIWDLLESRDIPIFPRPVHGRIPSFKGQEEAAFNLFSTTEWRRASLIKINPDAPQMPIRLRALQEGKRVIVASPRLSSGFILLDPKELPSRLYREASHISGFMRMGKRLSLRELVNIGEVDLIVEGSVVVNPYGERLGKGEGYGELEYAILAELGLANESTPIATTVHELQLIEDRLPQDPWDVPIDIIATPRRLIRCKRGIRPKGVIWDLIDEDKLRAMPILRELKAFVRKQSSMK